MEKNQMERYSDEDQLRILALLEAVGAAVTLRYRPICIGQKEPLVEAMIDDAVMLIDGTCEQVFSIGVHVRNALVHLWDKISHMGPDSLLVIRDPLNKTKTGWRWNGHGLSFVALKPIAEPWS